MSDPLCPTFVDLPSHPNGHTHTHTRGGSDLGKREQTIFLAQRDTVNPYRIKGINIG